MPRVHVPCACVPALIRDTGVGRGRLVESDPSGSFYLFLPFRTLATQYRNVTCRHAVGILKSCTCVDFVQYFGSFEQPGPAPEPPPAGRLRTGSLKQKIFNIEPSAISSLSWLRERLGELDQPVHFYSFERTGAFEHHQPAESSSTNADNLGVLFYWPWLDGLKQASSRGSGVI